jgi:hypothetical protein
MASDSTLRYGATPAAAKVVNSNNQEECVPIHEISGMGRLYLLERAILEQGNTLRRRTFALRQDYVRPATLQEAHEQGAMLPTDGAAIVLGIRPGTLKRRRQRGAGPSYYRYSRRGPIVYSLAEVLSYKFGTRGTSQSAIEKSVEEKFFSRRAAALILGVSIALLKHWRRADVGPRYFQFGYNGRILYKLSDLNAFKAECLVVTIRGNKP